MLCTIGPLQMNHINLSISQKNSLLVKFLKKNGYKKVMLDWSAVQNICQVKSRGAVPFGKFDSTDYRYFINNF